MERTIGIDPGSSLTGWGLVEKSNGTFNAVAFGKIAVKEQPDPAGALVEMFGQIRDLLARHKPDSVSVERIFFATNARTVIKVSQARGVALLAAGLAGIPVYEYTPLQVKVALTGYGQAPKPQVGRMVQTILRLREIPKPDDVADALGIAICHLNSSRIKQ